MGFAPWIMTADADSFILNKEQVLACATTQSEIAKMYTEAVTGIQLA